MTGYDEGSVELVQLPALIGPGGGVIHFLGGSPEPALKSLGIFPYIMGHPGQPPLFLRIKSGGKPGAELCRPGEMVQNALFPPVLRNMRQIRLRVNPSSSFL